MVNSPVNKAQFAAEMIAADKIRFYPGCRAGMTTRPDFHDLVFTQPGLKSSSPECLWSLNQTQLYISSILVTKWVGTQFRHCSTAVKLACGLPIWHKTLPKHDSLTEDFCNSSICDGKTHSWLIIYIPEPAPVLILLSHSSPTCLGFICGKGSAWSQACLGNSAWVHFSTAVCSVSFWQTKRDSLLASHICKSSPGHGFRFNLDFFLLSLLPLTLRG